MVTALYFESDTELAIALITRAGFDSRRLLVWDEHVTEVNARSFKAIQEALGWVNDLIDAYVPDWERTVEHQARVDLSEFATVPGGYLLVSSRHARSS